VENRERHDQIADLEERIEELADALQRCRKLILGSKISIMAGSYRRILVTEGIRRQRLELAI
jgi:hypothetical protein